MAEDGWFTQLCSAALLNAAADARCAPEILELCKLPESHSTEVLAAHNARGYARSTLEGHLAVRQWAVKRCDARRAEVLAMDPAVRPFEPPPNRIFCEETGATSGLACAHFDAAGKAERVARCGVPVPKGGLNVGTLASLNANVWRVLLLGELSHVRVTSSTVNRAEEGTSGDCIRRKHAEVLELYTKYEAAMKVYVSDLTAWQAAGDESAPKPEKPFEPRYGHRNVVDKYVSELKIAQGCHVPGCARHLAPLGAAQISRDLAVLARWAGGHDDEDEHMLSPEEAAREAADATQYDCDTSDDEDDLVLDAVEEAVWYDPESAEGSQTETPRETQPLRRRTRGAQSQEERQAAVAALSPLAAQRIFATPGEYSPGVAREVHGALTRGRLSDAHAAAQEEDPFADPPDAMDVDTFRGAAGLEPGPSGGAPPFSREQIMAEEGYEETKPLDFDEELKKLGQKPWPNSPITCMSNLVARLSTNEILDGMKDCPVYAAQVYDLLHRALLRRRVKCHDCHLQKRRVIWTHIPAVEIIDVLGYWERCMDKTTGVMSDGPLPGQTSAMQARMWVQGVYQFDVCVCRRSKSGTRYPHLVCCRCQVEDAKAAAAAAGARAAARVRLCRWCEKGEFGNCLLSSRKERKVI